MEIQARFKPIQDRENQNVLKGKSRILPTKRQGLATRDALGEISNTIRVQADLLSKDCKDSISDCDKNIKANLKCNVTAKSNYSYVQSKIDTGLSRPITGRPPLRREESTAGHARAAIKAKLTVSKGLSTKEVKENKQEIKKVQKSVEENKVTSIKKKSIVKEETVSLEKLKLESSDSEEEVISLPHDIEDIDACDVNSPHMLSAYIKDIYRYLRKLESKYAIEKDHLKDQLEITGKMRATLIDWLVEVQQQFQLYLETLQLSIAIIDRYLQVVPNVLKSQLQLVGVTAMFLASKYEEIFPPDVSDFLYMTNHAYEKKEVFQCERQIMSKLGFSLARPLPLHFLRRFVKAAHGRVTHHHLAKYLVDLSLVEYHMAHYNPSELSAAALCLSLYLLTGQRLEDTWTPTLVYYTSYKLHQLLPIMKDIAQIVLNAESSGHKAVYRKYTDKSLAKVSVLPQLKGSRIKELAQLQVSVNL